MANETKHTPGPWVIDRNPDQRVGIHIRASVPTYRGAAKGVSVARITVGGGVADDVAGNAALIAAAPDLLAALLIVSTDLAQDRLESPIFAAEIEDIGFYRLGKGAVEAVRAAIAKAEGRS